ncbi:hypothetical protein G6F56_012877 [Rhizopus delemar]|nr:hypothetical protein G6F56_012877 [Rhizopus delemar]
MANYDVTPGRHFDSQISTAFMRGQSKEIFSFPKGLSGTIKLVKLEKSFEEVIKDEEEKKVVKDVTVKPRTRTNRHLRKSKRVISKKPAVREIKKRIRMTATAKKARAKLPEEVTVNIEKKPTAKKSTSSEKKPTAKKIIEKVNIKAPKLTKRQADMKRKKKKKKYDNIN